MTLRQLNNGLSEQAVTPAEPVTALALILRLTRKTYHDLVHKDSFQALMLSCIKPSCAVLPTTPFKVL